MFGADLLNAPMAEKTCCIGEDLNAGSDLDGTSEEGLDNTVPGHD